MTEPTAPAGIRRMLAAYDAMTSDEASLTALAEMAARLQAELELLFVEDADLVRAAGLPLARQINLRTGAAGPLALGELEAEMRAAGARLRRRLADAADRRRVRWSFRTVRGAAIDEVLLASRGADLLVLRHLRRWTRRAAAAEPASVARQTDRSVLLLEHGARTPGATALLFRPGEQGRRALALAMHLAAAGSAPLDILLPEPDRRIAARQAADAETAPGGSPAAQRYRLVDLDETAVLADTVARAHGRLLVLGADDPVLRGDDGWDRLVGEIPAVLLVR